MEMIDSKQLTVQKMYFSCTKGVVSKTRLEGDLRNSGRVDPLLATTHDEL